jgi:hypothetical protein
METKELERLIARHDDAELTPEERAALTAALANQPEARALLRQYQRLDEALGQMGPVMGQRVDFADFAARVQARLERTEVARPAVWRQWRIMVPLAAAAALAVVFLPWMRWTSPPTPVRTGEPLVMAMVRVDVPPAMQGMRVSEVTVARVGRGEPGRVEVTLAGNSAAAPVTSESAPAEHHGEVLWYSTGQSLKVQTALKGSPDDDFSKMFL